MFFEAAAVVVVVPGLLLAVAQRVRQTARDAEFSEALSDESLLLRAKETQIGPEDHHIEMTRNSDYAAALIRLARDRAEVKMNVRVDFRTPIPLAKYPQQPAADIF